MNNDPFGENKVKERNLSTPKKSVGDFFDPLEKQIFGKKIKMRCAVSSMLHRNEVTVEIIQVCVGKVYLICGVLIWRKTFITVIVAYSTDESYYSVFVEKTVDKQHYISVAVFSLFTNNYLAYTLKAYIITITLRLE